MQALIVALAIASSSRADYDSHAELRPEARCGSIPAGVGDAKDPGGIHSIHCQPLFWDLPAATRVGFQAAAAPTHEGPPPWYPNGLTDRPPPLYILDRNDDGVADDGRGYESPGPGRVRLCRDPDEVPWWKPVVDAHGTPISGADPTTGKTGPIYTVACRRGTRVRFGPWQIGRRADRQDDIAEGVVRFANSARLDRDVERGLLDAKKSGRVEWHAASEFYTHFATHHVVCWSPENATCNNPNEPRSASDMSRCGGYQQVADGPSGAHGKGACYAGDQDTRCQKPEESGESVREYAMFPGRTYFGREPGDAEVALENQLWDCYQHLVPELPPTIMYHFPISSFGLDRHADYRLQTGGLINVADVRVSDTDPGKVIGGAVGEMIIQYFTEPFSKPGLNAHPPATSVRKGGLEDLLRSGGAGLGGRPTPRAGEKR